MTDPLPDATPAAIVTTFAAASVRSLAWEGDVLVDWVGGGTRWTLQGERADSSLLLAFSFDMAQSLPAPPSDVRSPRAHRQENPHCS